MIKSTAAGALLLLGWGPQTGSATASTYLHVKRVSAKSCTSGKKSFLLTESSENLKLNYTKIHFHLKKCSDRFDCFVFVRKKSKNKKYSTLRLKKTNKLALDRIRTRFEKNSRKKKLSKGGII